MSLLENIGKTIRQGWDVAKVKGEQSARIGRLRLEMIRLERERDQQFARLGRAYHANSNDTAGLQPLILEIDRLTQTIRDRESVLAQLLEQDSTPKTSSPEEPLDFAAESSQKPE